MGIESIPKRGPFILASNHRSHLDPVLVAVFSSRRTHFMAKKELFDVIVLGRMLAMMGCIRLNREGPDRAALKEGLNALHNGRGLGLFPEGKRSVDGTLGAGKAGVALFAFNTGAPVIPLFVKGTERALPPKRRFVRLTKVAIIAGKRLYPPTFTDRKDRKSAYQEFTNRVMEEIAGLEKKCT